MMKINLNHDGLCKPGYAVLFDLDGTVIDSLAIAKKYLALTLEKFGIDTQGRELAGLFARGETEILGSFGLEGDLLEQVRTEWARQNSLHESELVLFEGMNECILGVKEAGCPVGIVTGRTRQHFENISIIQQVSRLMDVVVLEGDTPEAKPHPHPILYALEQLGVPPERAFYIGDSPNDMECARRAGCQAILVTWGVADNADRFAFKPHHVVQTPQELKILLMGDRYASIG